MPQHKQPANKEFQLMRKHVKYTPLVDENKDSNAKEHIVYSQLSRYIVLGNLILFLASLCSLFLALALYEASKGHTTLLRGITYYSPFLDTLKPKWAPDQYTTHNLYSSESIFRQDPSDAVDSAWARITDIGVLPITPSDVLKLGKNPSTVVKAPESWGHGADAHLAHLDGLHLIHCLNAMRKSLHWNFEYYFPNGTTSKTYRAHLSHCQEALVKHLMCQPSVELITYNWVERQRHPFPDFDITRKCWDFEALLRWQDERRIQGINHRNWGALRKPEDVEPLPIPLLMLEAYNVTIEEAYALKDWN